MRQNRTPRTDDAPSGVCRLRIHTVSINNKPHVVFPPRQTLEAATCKQSKTRLSRSGAGADRRALFTSLIVLVTLVFVSRTTLAPRLLCCNYLSNTPMGFMLHLIWINHRGQLSVFPFFQPSPSCPLGRTHYGAKLCSLFPAKNMAKHHGAQSPRYNEMSTLLFSVTAATTSNYCVLLCYITTDAQWARSAKGWVLSQTLMISMHRVIKDKINSFHLRLLKNKTTDVLTALWGYMLLNANASMATGSSGPPTFLDYRWCSTS